MRVLVTGGCGFIGSNFIKYLLTDQEITIFPDLDLEVFNVDKQTYAGQGKNLEHMGLTKHLGYSFVKGDICDRGLMERVFSEHKPEMVFNFAAESHVDRGILNASPFVTTNLLGTQVLLDLAVKHDVDRFVQVSTDEVYGSLSKDAPSSKETDLKHPRSAYSASKSGAEDLAIAACETHALPVVITRSSNNYGPYQFPEKLLPLFITNLIEGKKVPLMWSPENPGLNVRDWLHVEDNCRAIWFLARKGIPGGVYNIPGKTERTNAYMTSILINEFGFGEEMVERVPHRLGHDFRYSINGDKLRELGFEYKHTDLGRGIKDLVTWYKANESWWRPLKK